jgi:hypothetical protein
LRDLKVRTQGQEMTLEGLRTKGLSLRQARDLEAMIRPLSKEGRKPPRQDLATFWQRVERAVRGLGANVRMGDLEDEHIHVLAPLVLGDHVYS